MGKFITNDTPSPMYVGGRLIPPYDGRHFEDHEVPPEHRDAVAQVQVDVPSLDDDLRILLAGSVKAITEGLDGLTQEALERLRALEGDAQHPRKTLLQAIEAEVIRRADDQLQAEQAQLAAAALAEAQEQLQAAQAALHSLPADAPDAEREQATAALDEAIAKVDALTPAQD